MFQDDDIIFVSHTRARVAEKKKLKEAARRSVHMTACSISLVVK